MSALGDRILEMMRGGMQPPEIEKALRAEGVSKDVIMTAVFGLAVTGKIRPTNAKTEILIQDAAERLDRLLPPPVEIEARPAPVTADAA
jgi:hypothetical protein